MECFVCTDLHKKNDVHEVATFTDVKILKKHIKYEHLHIKEYDCLFCPSRMTDLRRYGIHVERHYVRNQKYDSVDNTDLICEVNAELPDLPDCQTENVTVEHNADDRLETAVDYDSYSLSIEQKACRYVLELLKRPDNTMTRVLEIINTSEIFLAPISDFIHNNLPTNCTGDREKFLKLTKDPFIFLRTEYKLIKYLKSKDLYSKPVKYLIRSHFQEKTRKGVTTLEKTDDTGVLMPILFMFRKFIEMPGVYRKMMDKMERLMATSSPIINFVQCAKWRKIVQNNPGKILVPYVTYNDDFNVGNQQGVRSLNQGISVVNVHFPLLEDWELSKLEYLFPICFIKALYTKHGNKSICLLKLRDILFILENDGIDVTIDGETVHIHFVLANIIGDNLAVHQMLDFTTGFLHNHMCHICLMNRKDRDKCVQESENMFRTIEHYNENKNNPQSGYNRNCPFNKLPNFHVLENYSADIMHDVLEGIAVYGYEAAMYDLIRRNLITEADIARSLDTFDYGEIDSRNKLSSANISKGKFYLTASESFLFAKYFPLILQQFISNSDPAIKYLIVLEKLVNICMAKQFTNQKLEELRSLVKKHHQMYMNFQELKFDPVSRKEKLVNRKLKPKHHFGVHYFTIILQSGPLISMWAMRHEGLNKLMKSYTYVSFSRVNLSLSMAKKFMLMFSYFIDKNAQETETSLFTYKTSKNFRLADKIYASNIVFPFPEQNITLSYNWIIYKGTDYKIGYFLFINDKLLKIIDIISTNVNSYVILEEFKYERKVSYNYCVIGDSENIYSTRTFACLGKPFNACTLRNNEKVFKINEYDY